MKNLLHHPRFAVTAVAVIGLAAGFLLDILNVENSPWYLAILIVALSAASQYDRNAHK